MPKVIKYERIPDLLFLPAIMTRDLRLARVIPIEKRKKEEPDVIIKSPISGVEDKICRKELTTRYRYTNGKKIVLGAWRRNHKALVMAQCQDLMYAMYIPPGFQLQAGGTGGEPLVIDSTRRGLFLLCESTTNGEIDRDNPRVILPKYFRKMFIMRGSIKKNIAKCTEIQEYLAKKHGNTSLNFEFSDTAERVSAIPNTPAPQASKQSVPTSTQQAPTHVSPAPASKPVERTSPVDVTIRSGERNTLDSKDVPSDKFKVIARVVHLDSIVGFILMDSFGNTAEFNKRQMINFAQSNKLTNAGVRVKNGKEYLYGIGVKLSELPAIEQDYV